VTSDVRFGPEVLSPMVSRGEADFLLVLTPSEVEVARPMLRPGGLLILPEAVDESKLGNKRSLNVALLGVLSARLGIDQAHWLAALHAALPERLHQVNDRAFQMGRESRP
jgi:indolepyruvate ferredoxin oxidoreductase beta subunit